jgi:hypothetical protein
MSLKSQTQATTQHEIGQDLCCRIDRREKAADETPEAVEEKGWRGGKEIEREGRGPVTDLM